MSLLESATIQDCIYSPTARWAMKCCQHAYNYVSKLDK